MNKNNKIGIFDSGLGGLTIVKSLMEILPNESIIYFGDTLHLPYGDKSINAITQYTKKITNFMLENKVKLILIACNSASAASYKLLKNYIGSHAILVDVINPVIEFLKKTNYQNKKIGLIGTRMTINSHVYEKRLKDFNCNLQLYSIATPLFVPIIEEGFFNHKIIDIIISEYLSNSILKEIEALILGCTHYPIIQNRISSFFYNKIDIIDTGKIVANEVKNILIKQNLLSTKKTYNNYYVSNYTEKFLNLSRLFISKEINIEYLNIFS